MQWAGQAVVEVPGGPDHGPPHCDVVGERKETRRTRSVYRHFYLDVDLRGTKMDAAVRHFENFWQFYDLVQVLLCADL